MSNKTSNIIRYLKTVTVNDFLDNYANKIDMDADYQREKIWSREQQEALLDSILIEIDIPKLYLAEVNNKSEFEYECIDGKQRMISLLKFFRFFPESPKEKPLSLKIAETYYTYKQLKDKLPPFAKQMENYELHFLIYKKKFLEKKDTDFINKIFRRLQLGVRLAAGETLKSYTGELRDFIFKKVGYNGPFLRNTGISIKRFQRELALAQICFNSIKRHTEKVDDFARARTSDIEDFIQNNMQIRGSDTNLFRIKKVLEILDSSFGKTAKDITGRAAVISAYLFAEELFVNKKQKLISSFAKFYIKLINIIKEDTKMIRDFQGPKHRKIMDKFQRYILQASVEKNSIKGRHEFLKEKFAEYLKTGKIV